MSDAPDKDRDASGSEGGNALGTRRPGRTCYALARLCCRLEQRVSERSVAPLALRARDDQAHYSHASIFVIENRAPVQ
jgi:hypothetical protein